MAIRKTDADMTTGSIWRHLIAFSMPTMLGMLFQQLYNTVDAVIVGRYVGDSALAAVGSTGSIVNMMVCLGMGLSAGAGIAISQYYGAHDEEKLRTAVHTAVTLMIILALVLTGVGIMLVNPLLRLMKTPDDVMTEAVTYLTIYFSGLVGMLIYNIGAGILRAVGDSRRPLYFLICSAILNTVGDLVFVVIFQLGVAGVAYATIIAQAVSAILVLTVLFRTEAAYGLRLRHFGIDWTMLKKVCGLGLPSSIQMVITSFSNVFVQSYINAFEKACMAGWTAYNKIDAFILLPLQGISMASATFVGQNFGAKQYKRAKEGVSICIRLSLIVTSVLIVAVMLLRHPLLSIFSLADESLDYGLKFILIITPFYLTVCFNQIYASALRGVGKPRTPMLVMLCSFVLFRQIFLFVNGLLGGSFLGTALAYPAGWVMASILITIAYQRCRILQNEPQLNTEGVNV